MKRLFLAAILLLLAPQLWGACSSTNWCVIYNSGVAPLTNYSDNMWNSLTYVPDGNLTYLWMNGGGGLTPESNGLFAYSAINTASGGGAGTMAAPYLGNGVNPWSGVSQCGDDSNSKTLVNRQGMLLAESITSTTGTCVGGCGATDYIHLSINKGSPAAGTGPLNPGNTTNGSGVIWVGNEDIRYGKCTSTNSFSGTVCSITSGTEMFLWGTSDGTSSGTQAALLRGTRQGAGYSAAVAHQGLCANGVTGCTPVGYAEPSGWDCYEPQLGNFVSDSNAWKASPTNTDFTDHASGVNRAGTWSHPSDRHFAAQSLAYDSKRGRIWMQFGWQESWGQQDTWSLCVFNKGGAGGGNALSTCGANDLYTATSTTPGWQRITWPGTNPAFPLYTQANNFNTQVIGSQNTSYQENAVIYDPQNDVLVNFGGLFSGSRHEIYIFCLATTSTGYGCTSANVGSWLIFKPGSGGQCSASLGFYCGDTGPRDGTRVAIDPTSHRIIGFGGAINNTWYSHTVFQFDAHTGDVCINSSDDASEPQGPPTNTTNSVSWCPMATVSALQPPEKNGSGAWNANLKFPDWAYNSGLARFEFYGGDGSGANGQTVGGVVENVNDSSIHGVWLYNLSTNTWTQPSLSATAGPQIPQLTGHNSWSYDSTDGVSIWLSGNATSSESLWQVPDTALGGTAPSTFTFSITVAGTGSGTITDTNSGFSCSSGTCSHTYTSGAAISLTDTVNGGSTFGGWSSDSGSASCSGTTVPCSFTITANSGTTATFNPPAATIHMTTLREGTTIKK